MTDKWVDAMPKKKRPEGWGSWQRFVKQEYQKKEQESKERVHAIETNLQIIRFADGKHARLRKHLAIYRLYKYLDCSPKHIADLTDYSEGYIRQVIGEVFKALCLSDKECTFKHFFTHEKSEKR